MVPARERFSTRMRNLWKTAGAQKNMYHCIVGLDQHCWKLGSLGKE